MTTSPLDADLHRLQRNVDSTFLQGLPDDPHETAAAGNFQVDHGDAPEVDALKDLFDFFHISRLVVKLGAAGGYILKNNSTAASS